MKIIRVGVIHADVHGCWYGLLFQPADEHGLIDHFPQCHYYFIYRNELKFGLVPGFELTKIYDPWPRHPGMETSAEDTRPNAVVFQEVLNGVPHICQDIDEVSEDVDLVFIADCQGDGSDHPEGTGGVGTAAPQGGRLD